MCVPSFVRPASAFSAIIQIPFLWKPFPLFPPNSTHTFFDFGQTRLTERKSCSPSGKQLPFRKTIKRSKERIGYEEQQPDQCPSGS